jgi:hypothetical protein
MPGSATPNQLGSVIPQLDGDPLAERTAGCGYPPDLSSRIAAAG